MRARSVRSGPLPGWWFRRAALAAITVVTIATLFAGDGNEAAQAAPSPTVLASISAGGRHTCAVTSGGGAVCWGENGSGQLGNGTLIASAVPVDVTGLSSGVQAISAGEYHTCALTTGGSLKCWGDNENGQLGNNSTAASHVPIDVPGLTSGVQAVSAGAGYTCAIKDGGVKCWGLNDNGQLGNNSTLPSLAPADVSGLGPGSGVSFVDAGFLHTCAIAAGGAAKCWGENSYGELGNNLQPADSPVPVDVAGLNGGVQSIATGYVHTCAVTAGGGVKCWGYGGEGALGNGGTADSGVPVDVTGLASGVAAVSTGEQHSCARTAAGAVKCWGQNEQGELGNNSTGGSSVPVDVAGTSGVQQVSAGHHHVCAMVTGGSAKCWGNNASGQLGDGIGGWSTIPVSLSTLAIGVSTVSVGGSHSCAVTTAGGVRCWGSNNFGQLGNNSTADSAVPVDTTGLGSGVQAVSAGENHTCALTLAGAVKCWGRNNAGQLGDGSNNDSAVPVEVTALGPGVLAVVAGIERSCAITAGGGAKCWGDNWAGQLGNNSTIESNVPVDVVGLASGVQAIASGDDQTCAVVSGGAKCWGYNGDGQLGNGTFVDSDVPVDVSGLASGVQAIAAGSAHACALTTGGGVKCWGEGGRGQLGNNSNVDMNVPVDVAGLGSGIEAIGLGYIHSCAVTVGGGAKCWGRNVSGELGNHSTIESWVPVDVSGLGIGVDAISGGASHTCGLVAGGIFCWGNRGRGRLGDGIENFSLVPVAVVLTAQPGPCPGPAAIALGAGATGAVFCGGGFPLTAAPLRAPGALPDSVPAVFSWDNAGQLFDFWFRGFPDAFQTLTAIAPGNFYFFQSPGGGLIPNAGGGTTLAAAGANDIDTVSGANGAVWSGSDHATADLNTYANIAQVSAIFQWDNAGQLFDFWFRGFPDNFQTLSPGIQRGGYYFFQAPAGQTIVMD